ncbi:PREDICTED: uncharacterized protein LOC106746967 [Dinoponera quadriceps]|uniref:Uncharacterized protein LOC106746967 n=1 Tax=Dinoponera quadriceps TaxID=609295 RepID=A0A6P3XYY5_DINQU|nr:PREDICTED: uncharacterized protein LOC106746967 [Dinoponera quadriceps]
MAWHDVTITRDDAEHVDARWKPCLGYNRDILGVLGKSTVVPTIYLGIQNGDLFVWKKTEASRRFALERAQQAAAGNSVDLGIFRKHLLHFNEWAAEFKRSRTSLEDDPREGRPKTATTPETIEKVLNIVLDDRRVKVYEMTEAVGISEERVRSILHEELGMRKLCARWVPHLLNADQKQMRKRHSQECLDRYKRDSTDFVRRFVTMDETWVQHYTPENKQQSKHVLTMGELRDLRYDLLDNPPYSPDLAPSYFLLFPNLKKFVSGKRFASNEEVERTVDEYFNSLPESHFREGIPMLKKRWTKCVEVKGDYVEK